MSIPQAEQPAPVRDWPECTHVDGDDSCAGIQVDGFDYCLAHLDDDQLSRTLAQLYPGAPLDASGTPIDARLLSRILLALKRQDGPAEFGPASFDQAIFLEEADFNGVKFTENASFKGANFSGETGFTGAIFASEARFSRARFSREAIFKNSAFSGAARFGGVIFDGIAMFTNAQFVGDAIFGNSIFYRSTNFSNTNFGGAARFVKAQFNDYVRFNHAEFTGSARFECTHFAKLAQFRGAKFTTLAHFGQAKFSDNVSFYTARFGRGVAFDAAHFMASAMFGNVNFGDGTRFDHVNFSGAAVLDGTRFLGTTTFVRANFHQDAMLRGAKFGGYTRFSDVEFNTIAEFDRAKFAEDAAFDGAQFRQDAAFDHVEFRKNISFEDANFETSSTLGPFSASNLSLRRAVFGRRVLISVAAAEVSCCDTVWRDGVTLQLRYSAVDLERATFTAPSFVGGSDRTFESANGPLKEYRLRDQIQAARGQSTDLWIPVLLSLRGVDCFNLSVADLDLSRCCFSGARVLDQLRIEGRCIFSHPPDGRHMGKSLPLLWRWSNRQSLDEERIWRATTRKYSGWANTRSTMPADVRPERLAGLYRQLRKAEEDAKNEPGAADFYYGEMEMRRHATSTPTAERTILWLYWLISGYGLRALRSLMALIIVGSIVTVTLLGWGLAATPPDNISPQKLTGVVAIIPNSGAVPLLPNRAAMIDATIKGVSPQLPPANQRWTSGRTGTALEVTLESFVFRSSEQSLTNAGIWTSIAARILGPILLALTLLAVRNRVKR